jgi:hypothetical protein
VSRRHPQGGDHGPKVLEQGRSDLRILSEHQPRVDRMRGDGPQLTGLDFPKPRPENRVVPRDNGQPARTSVASTAASTAAEAASSERYIETDMVSVSTSRPPPLTGGSSSTGPSGSGRLDMGGKSGSGSQ